jgi:DNA-binding NtrC family response regulator
LSEGVPNYRSTLSARQENKPSSKDTNAMDQDAAQVSTILVVEDEALIRIAVSAYLRECGYRVLEAGRSTEAMELIKAQVVDLVFTDVDMPGDMDGFGLARWVRERDPDLPIIITSGISSIARRATELCGESPFLNKPYAPDQLAACIGSLVALSRRRSQMGMYDKTVVSSQ